MTLITQSYSSSLKDEKVLFEIINKVSQNGFIPLIASGKMKFFESFGHNVSLDQLISFKKNESYPSSFRYYQYEFIERYSYLLSGDNVAVTGDIFYSLPNRRGIIYALITNTPQVLRNRQKEGIKESNQKIEIGFIGQEEELFSFEEFKKISKQCLSKDLIDNEWNEVIFKNKAFDEFSKGEPDKFISALRLTDDEFVSSKIMLDEHCREIALLIKRSGAILSADLEKKITDLDGKRSKLTTLLDSGLVNREYVVICNKTSNQINRVKNKEAVGKMAENGVCCSCGKLISEERIEEIYSPTQSLQKILNQSYWASVLLVKELSDLKIPIDRILLNVQDNSEEIDAFADINGTLFMFELKTSEFSMGHAYPFGGRIGLYKPGYAVIISAVSIAPEVKEYFNRIKPETEIVYISSLTSMKTQLEEIVTQIRSKRAIDLLALIGVLTNAEIPIIDKITPQIGLSLKAANKRRDRGF